MLLGPIRRCLGARGHAVRTTPVVTKANPGGSGRCIVGATPQLLTNGKSAALDASGISPQYLPCRCAAVAKKLNVVPALAHAQVTQRKIRQPVRQDRIEVKHVVGCVWLEADDGAQKTE